MDKPDRDLVRRGLGHIWEYAKGEPVALGLAVFGAVVYSAATVGSTIVLGLLVDDVILPLDEGLKDGDRAKFVLFLVAAAAFGRAVGVITRRFFGAMMAARTKANLQSRGILRLLEAPLSHLRETPTGTVLANVDSDADAATEPLHPLAFTVGALSLVFFALGALFLVDPFVGLVGLTLIPSLIGAQRIFTKAIQGPALEMRRLVGDVARVGHESFDGALVVKTLGRQEDEKARFEKVTRELRDVRIRITVIRAWYFRALEMAPSLGSVLLIAVGAWRVDSGAITSGELIQSIALLAFVAFPLAIAGYFLGSIPPATVGRDRIDGLLVLETDPLLGVGASKRLPQGPLAVKFEGVSVGVGGVDLIENINLTVEAGETVALVGATGSGKSTIFRALARLIETKSGRVEIGGLHLDEIENESLRNRVGVALQEPFLFGATVHSNLALGRDVTDDRFVEATSTASAGFIDELPSGAATTVGERGVTLSGGQRQRVALARALAGRPGLLLLDDATSAVDPVIEEQILDGLGASELTVLVVAHRMSTIALADRVVFVADGTIKAVGHHDELLADPSYAALVLAYEAQS